MTISLNSEQRQVLKANEEVIDSLNNNPSPYHPQLKDLMIEAHEAYNQPVWKILKKTAPQHYFYIPSDNYLKKLDELSIILLSDQNLMSCPNEVMLNQYHVLKKELNHYYPEINIKLFDISFEATQFILLYFKGQKITSRRLRLFGYEKLLDGIKDYALLAMNFHEEHNLMLDYVNKMEGVLY